MASLPTLTPSLRLTFKLNIKGFPHRFSDSLQRFALGRDVHQLVSSLRGKIEEVRQQTDVDGKVVQRRPFFGQTVEAKIHDDRGEEQRRQDLKHGDQGLALLQQKRKSRTQMLIQSRMQVLSRRVARLPCEKPFPSPSLPAQPVKEKATENELDASPSDFSHRLRETGNNDADFSNNSLHGSNGNRPYLQKGALLQVKLIFLFNPLLEPDITSTFSASPGGTHGPTSALPTFKMKFFQRRSFKFPPIVMFPAEEEGSALAGKQMGQMSGITQKCSWVLGSSRSFQSVLPC